MPEQTPKRAADQIEPANSGKIWRAFLKPGRGQLVVGVVLCLTALLVVWTLRSRRRDAAPGIRGQGTGDDPRRAGLRGGGGQGRR